MKTTLTKKAVALVVLLLALFALPQQSKAQCPTINNNILCDVEVVYYIYDSGGVLCFTSAQMTIQAGTSFPVPCACTPMGLFVVELISVGGTPFTPPPSVSYPGSNTTPFPSPVTCIPAGSTGTSMVSSTPYVVDIN